MDRLTQLRNQAGTSRDSTLDTSTTSEAYMTANESSSRYFSATEEDSSFDVSPIRDVSLASVAEAEDPNTGSHLSNLSPISRQTELLDIEVQIDAANILSGGVNIFDDNDNSYDGNQLVIDDNVNDITATNENVREINDNCDHNEVVVVDSCGHNDEVVVVDSCDTGLKKDRVESAASAADKASEDTEVVLHIEGKNVKAFDIGNNLYLYRKEEQGELVAVQKIDNDQPFKFLKVRENDKGNLEVYEEILEETEAEMPIETPSKDVEKEQNVSNLPADGKVIADPVANKPEVMPHSSHKEALPTTKINESPNKEVAVDIKTESQNSKTAKINETKKSPVIHSTPNKEGIPLTKTMVDQKLDPHRHLDKVKTIEVNTDGTRQTLSDSPTKYKNIADSDVNKIPDISPDQVKIPRSLANVTHEKPIIETKETPLGMVKVPANLLEQVSEKSQDIKKETTNNSAKANRSDNEVVGSSQLNMNVSEDSKVKENKDGIDGYTLYGLTPSLVDQELANSGKVNKLDSTTNDQQQVDDELEHSCPNTRQETIFLKDKSNNVEDGGNVKPPQAIAKSDGIEETLDPIKKLENNPDINQVKMGQNSMPPHSEGTKQTKPEKIIKDQSDQDQGMANSTILQKEIECSSKDDSLIKDNIFNLTNTKEHQNTRASEVKVHATQVLQTSLQDLPLTASTNKQDPKQPPTSATGAEGNSAQIQPTSLLDQSIKATTYMKDPTQLPKSVPVEKSVTQVLSTSVLDQCVKATIRTKNLEQVAANDTKVKENTTPALPTVVQDQFKKASTNVQVPAQQTASATKGEENMNEILPTIAQFKNITTSEQVPCPNIQPALNNPITPKETNTEKGIILLSDKHNKTCNVKGVNTDLPLKSAGETVVNKCEDANLTITNETEDIKCNPSKYHLGANLPSYSVDPTKFLIKQDFLKVYSKQTDPNVKSNPQKSGIKSTPVPTNIGLKPFIQSESSKQIKDIKPDASKVVSTRTNNIMPVTVHSLPDSKSNIKKEMPNVSSGSEKKPYNNNHTAVPFGKWTEANRQEFLNKIKESKVPSTMTNTKQIKQPNDLNRREFLQKKDIHRNPTNNSSAKSNEQRVAARLDVKTDMKTYIIKPTASRDSLVSVKYEAPKSNVPLVGKLNKIITKPDVPKPVLTTVTVVGTATNQNERHIRNNQDLIDKTIEGIINRVITAKPEESIPNTSNERKKETKISSFETLDPQTKHPASLDALEMKMNELHGIPFVERPPHQLPKAYNLDIKTYSQVECLKTSKEKVPDTLPQKNTVPQKISKQTVIDVDSDDEIINYQPVTGDIEKRYIAPKIKTKIPVTETVTVTPITTQNEAIITETDFDKFARRNSFTYENRLTVKFEGNESQNVVQAIVEKEPPQVKKYSRNELLLAEAKVKSDQKQLNRINHPIKSDASNKCYPSKLQIAYQSAITAKRKTEPPITIIEDKPVKVLFIDTNTEFKPGNLNVQGKELSPAKKKNIPESSTMTTSGGDSLDSDLMDSVLVSNLQEDNKGKVKHQRKQVLTPVETPELELIEPRDLDITGSPKKKRKTEEVTLDKTVKNVVPKKSYLLGRSTVTSEIKSTQQDLTKSPRSDVVLQNAIITHKDTASAIDNLVKAAELLETQSENLNSSTISVDSDHSGSKPSPAKRGRGRPRKYPLGDGTQNANKVTSPLNKPLLIDAKPSTNNTTSDNDTSDDEMVRENWTMGKINENIVCPICKKLFRSENVVFKHVKHCTGPSPNRSESDKQSRRSRQSQESETKSVESKFDDLDYEPPEQIKQKKVTPKKRISKDIISESRIEKEDQILIDDTPKDKLKQSESRVSGKTKTLLEGNLSCDICGKTFRQLSYLVSHKWQHKKEGSKKIDQDTEITTKTVFSCEVCKKQFRKLHHLVQHRIIHNPSSAPSRSSRKSSFEQMETKIRNQHSSKPVEDPSAAFRCEPCDKSFRKLHHLVEHRETHDGQNRQKIIQVMQMPEDKIVSEPPPQCDICKKTFRKLHHLIEHKEQHLETSSDKSDDKSIKSSLSTKDIIHECRLCYMVFPNEHSLNKHSVFCQKKKKPTVAKPEENEIVEKVPNAVEKEVVKDATTQIAEEKYVESKGHAAKSQNSENSSVAELEDPVKNTPKEISAKSIDAPAIIVTTQRDMESSAGTAKDVEISPKIMEDTLEEVKQKPIPRNKTPIKDKNYLLVKKRQKLSHQISEDVTVPESSDDDEVRYMLNPEYKSEQSMLFMEVRAKKRSSLQIEQPNKESAKRRASLQHPPKIPRLKAKSIEAKVMPTKTTAITKNITKISKAVAAPSTDSDDSDIKYSFPETIVEKVEETEPNKEVQVKRKSTAGKRKSLSGIAKRKSVGKPVVYKHREREKLPEPVKVIKRRTLGVEHRCDCGQLFSSAALLSRHTTLAHTPPRIRRRRSPPPPPPPPAASELATSAPQTSKSRKSSAKSDQTKPTRKSTTGKSEKKVTPRKISNKSGKDISSGSKTSGKLRAAHKGVPVPEKMKKLAEKLKG